MPIYEYECVKCGHTLDAIQKFSDPALTECPVCHESSLRKRISAPAFHLKGSGWYVTDFKDKPKEKTKPADDSKPSTETAAKTEPSESKSATTETTTAAKKTDAANN